MCLMSSEVWLHHHPEQFKQYSFPVECTDELLLAGTSNVDVKNNIFQWVMLGKHKLNCNNYLQNQMMVVSLRDLGWNIQFLQ